MRIYEDLRTVQRRLGVVQAVVVLAVAGLVVYFWHLQVIRGKYFRELAENNRIRAVPIPAPRGPLFDRKGRILAENRSSFNVVVTTERRDELRDALQRLSRLISFDPGEVRERLNTQGPRFRSLVVKADASEEDVATVEARRLEEPETSVTVVPLRSYPLGTGLAHSLGYVGEISDRQVETAAFEGVDPGSIVGQAGVELQYNRELMGKDGLRRIVVNSRGVEVTEAERRTPVDGPPASLTIDLDLQAAAVEAMAGKSGSVVAIDPGTGEVLAYLSTPAFDPNSFSTGIKSAEWSGLLKDPEKPLMNRPIQGIYAPGSTYKVLSALAALQEHVITPQTRFHCPGYLAVYNTVFRCHKQSGHGSLDLARALALSCNVYFYNVGIRLEIERLSRYSRLLGLGRPTGIDLPHEVAGIFQDPEWKMRTQNARWFPAETVSVSIGQAMSVTPMQLLRVAAAVANGGKLVTPHLMKVVGGRAVEHSAPRDLGFRPEVVAAVREAMESVVREGSGQRAKLEGITVAGKTGSAQVVTHARLEANKDVREYQPHGWFIAFAPSDKPRVAMVVIVEHGVEGGRAAAPVAGQVLARYFGVRPIGPGMTPPPDNPPVDPSPQPLRAEVAPPSPSYAASRPPE
ncbi:MAG TPA: penicillin-binding protein 2 [Vicinamibacteria bacterium]|nr:penicillin-binding protein 2 [Vicinamibacteria bacterium]